MSFGIPVRNGLGIGLLASTFLSSRNRAAFSPASLFTAGEPGAWYDPSDLTTLFQDSAGTTPVTTPAQSVGLMLDKSQGLVLGSELVAPINFTSGWTSSGAAVTFDSATTFTAAGVANVFRAYLTVGVWYKITFKATFTGGIILYNSNTAANQINSTTIVSGVEYTFYFLAAATQFNIRTTGAATVTIDNVSVKLLAGNHATQSTSAQRPTYGVVPATGRRNLLTFTEQFDNAVWGKANSTVTANSAVAPDGTATADTWTATVTGTTATARLLGTLTVTTGVNYTASIYVKAAGKRWVLMTSPQAASPDHNCWFDLQNGTVGTKGSAVLFATMTAIGDGWFRISTTSLATTSPNYVFVSTTTGDNTTSVVADGNGIYIWGAQLETGSTVTAYQRVVSSFDVTETGVASLSYVSFDGTDDGMLTGTITPAIDKAQVFAGVRKLSDAGNGIVVELTTAAFTTAGGLYMIAPQNTGASGNFGFFSRGANGPSTVAITLTDLAPTTAVLTGQGDIATDTMTIRRNGIQEGSITQDQGAGNYATAPLYIGRRAGSSLPLNGQIFSLILRFGANLSADTILQTETWVGDKTGINIPLSVSPTIYDRFNATVLDRDGQTIEVR